MDVQQERTDVEEGVKQVDFRPMEQKWTDLPSKQEGGLELDDFDCNCSVDILPGGRLPGSNDDTRFSTSKLELASYYFFYVGNNGEDRAGGIDYALFLLTDMVGLLL